MKKQDARKLSRDTQEELRKRVIHAIENEGMKQVEAVRFFQVSRAAISKWLRIYRSQGWEKLKKKTQGRPKGGGKLKGWQCAQIVKMITDQCPDQLKLPFALWTRRAVGQLIEERFGVKYSLSSLSSLLKRWGFSSQKPIRRAYERNPKLVQSWMDQKYPEILKQSKKEKAEIHWLDEMGLRSDHSSGKSFGKIGKTPVISKTGSRFSCSMVSTVNQQGKMRFMVYHDSFTVDVFLKFLKRLIYQSKKKIYLILDNLRVHHSKRVQSWQRENADKIEFFYLPAYSPELNPDELLNQDVKANAIRHEKPRSKEQLNTSLRKYLKKIQQTPSKVANYFKKKELKYILDAESYMSTT